MKDNIISSAKVKNSFINLNKQRKLIKFSTLAGPNRLKNCEN